jgi:hypothetical protein
MSVIAFSMALAVRIGPWTVGQIMLESTGGGNIANPTTVTDLIAGSRIRVELTSGWPVANQVVPCELGFLIDTSFKDMSGQEVTEEKTLAIFATISLLDPDPIDVTQPTPPTHVCGLVPECPPRDW